MQVVTLDAADGDTDLDMDKNFLQELRDLRTFSSDKDISDEHKSAVYAEMKAKDSKEFAKTYDPHVKVCMCALCMHVINHDRIISGFYRFSPCYSE